MKTKTLLIAAAALAVGVISSEAQVYSQNIVGYYNQPLVAAPAYNLVANQFNVGLSNGANEIFGNVPDGTAMLQWTGSGFVYTYKDFSAPPALWYMSDYGTPTNPPIILPGTAVFLQLPTVFTNTVAGSVVVNSGASVTNNQVAAPLYNMVGSALPVGGPLTNSLYNFNPPDGTAILQFNGSGYVYTYKDFSALPDQFYMSDYGTPTNPPSLNVGAGIFLQPPTSYKWIQSLP
jgi:hypothetical protein